MLIDYDEAEQSREGPTVAMWARAQAVRALLPGAGHGNDRELADRVNTLAEIIITGSPPSPPEWSDTPN
jgi:hypothetical protein